MAVFLAPAATMAIAQRNDSKIGIGGRFYDDAHAFTPKP